MVTTASMVVMSVAPMPTASVQATKKAESTTVPEPIATAATPPPIVTVTIALHLVPPATFVLETEHVYSTSVPTKDKPITTTPVIGGGPHPPPRPDRNT